MLDVIDYTHIIAQQPGVYVVCWDANFDAEIGERIVAIYLNDLTPIHTQIIDGDWCRESYLV
jgi:hypothetical protein